MKNIDLIRLHKIYIFIYLFRELNSKINKKYNTSKKWKNLNQK